MANIYVRSTDGVNTDSGATWALAKLDLTGAAAIDAVGDRIYVSDNHAEVTAGAITLAFAGNVNDPTKVLAVDDAAEPPVAMATASVSTTGGSAITISGCLYAYGIAFHAGTAALGAVMTLGSGDGDNQVYDSCSFDLNSTNAANEIRLGSVSAGFEHAIELRNCGVQFSAAGQAFNLRNCRFRWSGGSFIADTAPTNLIEVAATGLAQFLVENVDLTNIGNTTTLCTIASGSTWGMFRNCKLPPSWNGLLTDGNGPCGTRVEMHNCSRGSTKTQLWVIDHRGEIFSNVNVVRTGGASDGVTPYSWQFNGVVDPEYPVAVLRSTEIHQWNNTIGSPVTATVEIVTDGFTLTDADVWIEGMYLGASGSALGSMISDGAASILATPAAQASSSAAWTTTGMTTPIKQKLSVTFTPQEKGVFIARVCAATTTPFIVDPLVTIT